MASRERCFSSLSSRGLFSSSVRCYAVSSYTSERLRRKRGQVPPLGPLSGKGMRVDKIWRKLFENPAQWWDTRGEKVDQRYPDFKHKKTLQPLWITNRWTPSWVAAQLAAVAPGTFDEDAYAWNKKLERYVKEDYCEKALDLFERMQRQGMVPNRYTFVPVLGACSKLKDLEHGKLIHQKVLKAGCYRDAYVSTSLVNMYAKCGSMENAWKVFDKMAKRGVVAWNAIISGFVNCRECQKALKLFEQMEQEGVDPDSVTFVMLLNACASLGALKEGIHFHEQIINKHYESDVYVGNSLVDMYAKCGSMKDAQKVFDKMRDPHLMAWTAMIRGYLKIGEVQEAFELSRAMKRERVDPDPVTFVELLKVCAQLQALEEGRRLHQQIIESGCQLDVFIGSSLVDMYAKCGSIEDARQTFNKISRKDVVAWGAMLTGYVNCGLGQEALELYRQMQQEGLDPDPGIFVGVLNACAMVAALEDGRRVHEQIRERGYDSDVYVRKSLVDMYAKCGSRGEAWQVVKKMP